MSVDVPDNHIEDKFTVPKQSTLKPVVHAGPVEASLDVDNVNHPAHYKGHPKGIECIDVIEDATYLNLGQAMKYLWRVTWGNKGNKIEDLEKAIWYINRHISNLKKGTAK